MFARATCTFLCIYTFLASALPAQPTKTYLSPRPVGTFLPYEYPTPTSKNLTVRIIPFAQWSHHSEAITQYFLGSAGPITVGAPQTGAVLDHRNFKFDESNPKALTGTLNFTPRAHNIGALVQFYQRWHRLFYDVQFPLVYTMQTLGMCVSPSRAAHAQNVSINNYFAGRNMLVGREFLQGCASFNLQERLDACRIAGARSCVSVADIYCNLGYIFSDRADARLSAQGTLIMPSTACARNRFLFEPRIGYGGHWVVGGRADGSLCIAHAGEAILHLDAIVRSHYILPQREKRTLGLRSVGGNCLPLAQYQILGLLGAPLVLPAANVLTRNVRVSPGQEWEGLIAARITRHGIVCSIGYDFWSRSGEKIALKQCWNSQSYAFPGSDYTQKLVTGFESSGQTQAAFQLNDANISNTIHLVDTRGNGAPIAACQLDCKAAASPSVVTHTIFAQLSTTWRTGLGTFELALGGAYEMPSDHRALTQSHIWLTFGAQY